MLYVGRSREQQRAAAAGNRPVEPYHDREKPNTTHDDAPMDRVQAALRGALPDLLERSRFAQHGAALQMTPQQVEAFSAPLQSGVAEALAQA
eukprot:2079029-Alexandrium_andersonii.AAC.1